MSWIGCGNISLLLREYLSSGVNVLTNGLKIFDSTNTDIFELIFSQSDVKDRQNYCRADFSNVWDPLTCWLW